MASTIEADDNLLRARVLDAERLSDKTGMPRFVGFLDQRERALCESWLSSHHDRLCFCGGHDEAERTVLGIFPVGDLPEPSWAPVTALGFAYRAEKQLTHRDFLGTLMSAGVKRSSVGDILCGEGLTVVFVHTDILPFLLSEITCVGGEGVRLIPDYSGELPAAHRFRDVSDTVASARLDCVVAALCRMSRGDAAEAIIAGRVTLRFLPSESVSATVRTGDTLSVRGCRKFRITELDALTRKGRLILKAQQYI